MEPSLEYASVWEGTAEKLRLAKACYLSLRDQPFAAWEAAVWHVSTTIQQFAKEAVVASSTGKVKARK